MLVPQSGSPSPCDTIANDSPLYRCWQAAHEPVWEKSIIQLEAQPLPYLIPQGCMGGTYLSFMSMIYGSADIA